MLPPMKYLLVLPLMTSLAFAQPYKVAVIGLVHGHAWGHLREMQKGDAAQLVGVSEPNPDLVAEAKNLGIANNLFFNDYSKMLDAVKPDFVWAFVENNRHLEIIKACAPRRIHVIFEKPLASSFKDALTIREMASQYRIFVMTNYQMAWWPSNYTAKNIADSGRLGQVYRLRGIVGHGGPSSEGVRNKAFFEWLTDPLRMAPER